MKSKPRNMKSYTPRRRRANKGLQKQQLKDFEHLLNMDLNTYLVLLKEGNKKQWEDSREKMRSHLFKYSSEMEGIGRDLGEGFPELIRKYLEAMHKIVAISPMNIDDNLINIQRHCAVELKKKAA